MKSQETKVIMLSEVREAKNLEDGRADYLAGKLEKQNIEKMRWLRAKIKEEKISVSKCMEQNFFSMAKSKIERIEKLQEELRGLRPKYEHIEPEVARFEVGNIHYMSYIGDSDLKPKWICVKRTSKTATFERLRKELANFEQEPESITRKIREHGGREYILYGTYSMAPGIYADKVVG